MLRPTTMLNNLYSRLKAAITWLTMPPRVGISSRKLLRKYLEPVGWVRSISERRSVDLDGPVPWYTYPFLKVLPELVKRDFRVLEYGCGSSTLWWLAHVQQVVSVEHDSAWCNLVSPQAPETVRLREPGSEENAAHYPQLRGFFDLDLKPASRGSPERDFGDGLVIEPFRSYAAEIFNYPDGYFDVVVVDGMARVLTAWCASRRIRRDGFIIFDNADREAYADAYRLLREDGFVRIDFWGFGPIKAKEWCTAVFTRNLDIFRR
jgi:SAM-dependent methyltransferase